MMIEVGGVDVADAAVSLNEHAQQVVMVTVVDEEVEVVT
jgi:hypothetical protein